MAQTAQSAQNPVVDQGDVNQTIPEGIKTPYRMGIFLHNSGEEKAVGSGPVFVSQDNLQNLPKIGSSDIKLSNRSYEMLEGFDIKRLVGILTQEAIKIANLDVDHITEKDRKAVLKALYALNPKKYPFVAANDEKFVEETLPEKEEVAEESPLATTQENKKIYSSPVFFNNTPPNYTKHVNREGENSYSDGAYPEVKVVLRSARLGKPKLALVNARAETTKELAEVEADELAKTKLEQQKVSADKLFESLHKPAKIEPTPSPEQKPTSAENSIRIDTPASLERKKRAEDVAELITTLGSRFGSNWKMWATPYALSSAHDDTFDNNMNQPASNPTDNLISWKDSPEMEEMSHFLNDITTLSEDALYTKYISSYVNENNPSSLAAVYGFSAYEIINGPEIVYGLTSDIRLEISSLLKQLGLIDKAIDVTRNIGKYNNGGLHNYQDYIHNSPKLTIHEYYSEIRKGIASSNNRIVN
ncbi:hypothetical protein K9M47_04310 [Candidatus Gracilibacteria bacterium]|nr:hypothetical protein [Candidatus Gracilibacteria bacterium]MCF7898644.1 hypothetical protein [Candidatus Paceibacterota bacterium]